MSAHCFAHWDTMDLDSLQSGELCVDHLVIYGGLIHCCCRKLNLIIWILFLD